MTEPLFPDERCLPNARLCKIHPGPSGRLHHGSDCPDKPGEIIDVKEYAKGRTISTWPPRGRVR